MCSESFFSGCFQDVLFAFDLFSVMCLSVGLFAFIVSSLKFVEFSEWVDECFSVTLGNSQTLFLWKICSAPLSLSSSFTSPIMRTGKVVVYISWKLHFFLILLSLCFFGLCNLFQFSSSLLILYIYIFFKGHTSSIWKFLGQGLNSCYTCSLSYSSNARSLTCSTTRELPANSAFCWFGATIELLF